MVKPPRHPVGEEVVIIGLEDNRFGCSCEEHDVCGDVVHLDCVLRLRHVQILDGKLLIVVCCWSFVVDENESFREGKGRKQDCRHLGHRWS